MQLEACIGPLKRQGLDTELLDSIEERTPGHATAAETLSGNSVSSVRSERSAPLTWLVWFR